MSKRPKILFRILPDDHAQQAKGRDAWALLKLIASGEKGVTPIDTPGPRWSGYVHNLRKQGVTIETVNESHAGPFPGTHARYILRSEVEILAQRHCERLH